MKIWRGILYLMLCCIVLQYYLGVIVYACRIVDKSDIAASEEPEIIISTITLKIEERRAINPMNKLKIVDAAPYVRSDYVWNDWSDVRKPSGLIAEELHEVMYYDENNYAPYYIEAERRYGINAVFLYAIAQNESQNGRSKIAKSYNNLFGWTSISHSGYKSFDSVEECIYYVAEALQNNYLNPNGKWFEGYGLRDVSKHYNNNDYWRDLTLEIADTMQSRIVSSRKSQSI